MKCSSSYSDNPKLESELSRFLKTNLGIECIFFTKKGTQEAHGYTIIDHATKTVFKGSDIMKLNEFINSSTNNITTEMPALSMKEHQQTEVSNSSQTLQDNSFVKNGLGEALNNIIDESLTPNFYFLRISFKKS